MKLIVFSTQLIALIARGGLNLLLLIANLLPGGAHNKLESQVVGNIYTYNNNYYLLPYFHIHTLTHVFYPIFHARLRAVRARQ